MAMVRSTPVKGPRAVGALSAPLCSARANTACPSIQNRTANVTGTAMAMSSRMTTKINTARMARGYTFGPRAEDHTRSRRSARRPYGPKIKSASLIELSPSPETFFSVMK